MNKPYTAVGDIEGMVSGVELKGILLTEPKQYADRFGIEPTWIPYGKKSKKRYYTVEDALTIVKSVRAYPRYNASRDKSLDDYIEKLEDR